MVLLPANRHSPGEMRSTAWPRAVSYKLRGFSCASEVMTRSVLETASRRRTPAMSAAGSLSDKTAACGTWVIAIDKLHGFESRAEICKTRAANKVRHTHTLRARLARPAFSRSRPRSA